MSKSNKLAQSLGLLNKPADNIKVDVVPSDAVKASQEQVTPSSEIKKNSVSNSSTLPSSAVTNSQVQQMTAYELQARQATTSDKMYNASFRHDSQLHERLEILAKQRSGGGAKFSLNSYLLHLVEKDLKEQGL